MGESATPSRPLRWQVLGSQDGLEVDSHLPKALRCPLLSIHDADRARDLRPLAPQDFGGPLNRSSGGGHVLHEEHRLSSPDFPLVRSPRPMAAGPLAKNDVRKVRFQGQGHEERDGAQFRPREALDPRRVGDQTLHDPTEEDRVGESGFEVHVVGALLPGGQGEVPELECAAFF